MRLNNRLLSILALSTPLLLGGCKGALMNPMGRIAESEQGLIFIALCLMLLVVVPVIVLTCLFAYKYRASNLKAEYKPEWGFSHKIELIVWGVPCLIVAILSFICWQSTHDLDPKRPLAGKSAPLEIDVVALDWKWLFIYPEQHVASVNEVAIPVNRPVKFVITSDTVMNSFFIPQLGSQIYAMTGMEAQLNLIADKAGVYDGMSANFSGAGFSWMNFKTLATPQSEFEAWIVRAKGAGQILDTTSYAALARPSEANAVRYYSEVQPALFDNIVSKYMSMQMDKDDEMKPGMDMHTQGAK